ncbi:MAG: restriction endonuclease [Phycisphaera sp. RhM]|nr:restriction endonuclease [Phycisphaera sp. RhM]
MIEQKKIWMIRAGKGGDCVEDFLEQKLVAIGFGQIEVSADMDKVAIEAKLREQSPKAPKGRLSMIAGQMNRFYSEIHVGDAVTTYDPSQRVYLLGTIQSEVGARDNHDLWRIRSVSWEKKVSRDVLKTATRNTLGAISALFLIKGGAAQDMFTHAVELGDSIVVPPDPAIIEPIDEDEKVLIEEIVAKAEEFIEDRIAKLDWEQMQELVSEILVAMGYRTRVSPKGPDRGNDIFASPDGLGLQEPRIFVEVKHRLGTQMGANEVRSFLGGRQPGDRCLYVSTGGFSKEARYEAERSNIPITLLSLPELRELVVEHYEKMRPAGTALVPLDKLYWPSK